MLSRSLFAMFLLAGAFLACMSAAYADEEPPYDGRKKCSSCHKSQYDSWK